MTCGVRMNDGVLEFGEDDHPYCGSMWNTLDELVFWMNEEKEVGWSFFRHIGLSHVLSLRIRPPNGGIFPENHATL